MNISSNPPDYPQAELRRLLEATGDRGRPEAVAAQRQRRSLEDLRGSKPADGVITGLATINADRFGAESSHLEIDAVIDPADTRRLVSRAFAAAAG